MFGKNFELNDTTMSIVKEIGRHMPGGFFIYKAEGKEELLYANSAVLRIYGCDSLDEFKALTGFTFKGMLHPEDYPAVTDSINKQIAASEGSIHAEAINNALSRRSYSEAKEEYIRSCVSEQDRDRLERELSLENIVSVLQNRERFSVTFLRELKDCQRHYRCDLGKVMMPEERIGIMIGFKDVDSEIRASQRLQEELESRLALQEKLIEEQSQREQQDKMITALASDYRVVYHIDLDKDEGVCYRADPDHIRRAL